MNIDQVIQSGQMDYTGIEAPYFLIGLLSAFENRFQAIADNAMQEISWKQFFAIICINICREAPTLKELSDILGSSHQNVKQILLKLEKKGFIRFRPDETDKRKQRIVLTEYCLEFCRKNDEAGWEFMNRMFDGIPQESIETTIRTILHMDQNLKEL